ncbi:hypothetical protein [Paraburkholderia sp.]|uniref:hypothetical protein n=1 Tax=Paraburkholderia sp. TaxID=1926495 RepID=UPI00239A7320|nr:hypothetical protein [Paraburkholderia sp.]MDE1179478.1 hypothetical protein [Paraburkholderia sp.]
MSAYSVIGFDKSGLYEYATRQGMHPASANKLMEFAIEIQRRALSHAALDRMQRNAEELGFAVEMRVIEPEGV